MHRFLCLIVAFVVLVGTSASLEAAKGKKPGKKPAKSPEKRFAKADTNNDGKLSLEEFLGKRSGDQKDKATKRFAKIDKDNDGTLDRKEARKMSNKNISKNFDTIDADKSGTLSWDEVNTYMAANPAGTKDQM